MGAGLSGSAVLASKKGHGSLHQFLRGFEGPPQVCVQIELCRGSTPIHVWSASPEGDTLSLVHKLGDEGLCQSFTAVACNALVIP
jgi:hypothetical protein